MQHQTSRRHRKPKTDALLLALGRDLDRFRRRCRRLKRNPETDWAAWSVAVDEATAMARRIDRIAPTDFSGLLVRYEALSWLLLEADDVIVDNAARDAFIAFGRILRWLVRKHL